MQSFDGLAADYERMASLAPALFVEWIIAQLPVHDRRALDAGCGAGHLAALLAPRFDHDVAIDISQPMIDMASKKRSSPNIEYRVQDLLELHEMQAFDFVVSCCVLHHLPDLAAALRKLRALIQPGGIAVLIDNVFWTTTPPRLVHIVSAWRHLPLDVVTHGWREARWMFGYRTNQAWLEHLATDKYLTRTAFRRRYGAMFPGGRFRSFGWAEGMVWQAP